MLLYDPSPIEWWWAEIGLPMFGVIATVVLGAASFLVALAAWRVSAAATATAREAHESTLEREANKARGRFAEVVYQFSKRTGNVLAIHDLRREAAETGNGAPGIVAWYDTAYTRIETHREPSVAGLGLEEQEKQEAQSRRLGQAHDHLYGELRRRVAAWIPNAVFDASAFTDPLFDETEPDDEDTPPRSLGADPTSR